MTPALGAVVFSAAVTVAVIMLLLRSPLAPRLLAPVNERSLHANPTPRVGGIGVVVASLPVLFVQPDSALRLVAAVASALAMVSLRDDWRPLPVGIRLGAHVLAAVVAVLALPSIAAGGEAMPPAVVLLSILAIAWMANLFNFMDGSDGLAGGMAAIGFGTLGWSALSAGHMALATACLALAAAAVAFLAFNFPPASVFLGDAGSIPLGFLAGALGWLGVVRGAWPPWFPVLVFSPFIADASLTLGLRALQREPLFMAHRSHHYQVLVLAGWSHRRLALTAWVVMALAAASALFASRPGAGSPVAILLGWVAVFLVAAVAIRFHVRR